MRPFERLKTRAASIRIVFAKELLEVRRDTRSLLLMLFLPVLAFPLLLAAAGLVAQRGMDSLRDEASVIAVGGAGADEARTILDYLGHSEGDLDARAPLPSHIGSTMQAAVREVDAVDPVAAGALGLAPRHLRAAPLEAAGSARGEADLCLRDAACDAVLWLQEPLSTIEDGGQARFQVFFDSSRDRSTLARQRIERLLGELGDAVVGERLAVWGRSREALQPFVGETTHVGEPRAVLIDFLSYIMILMSFTGALYPAIDLAAGEKERGTLETLLVTSAHRGDLVLGKFLVVALAASLSAILSGLGLVLSLHAGLLPAVLGASLRADPWALVASVLLLLPTACIFAALLLSLSIFARSFKEAQGYATPVHLLILLPAAVAVVPGVELTPSLALVPVVNVALGIRELWSSGLAWHLVALMIASTLTSAAIALMLCYRWFQREDVLFRS